MWPNASLLARRAVSILRHRCQPTYKGYCSPNLPKLRRHFGKTAKLVDSQVVGTTTLRTVVAAGTFAAAVFGLATTDSSCFAEEDEISGHHTVYGWIRPGHDPSAPVPGNDNRVLLITDVDATMTGCNESLDTFNRYWIQEQVPRNSCLVYNTARPCGYAGISFSKSGFTHLVMSGRFDLMRPDVLITCEGTEVFWLDPNYDTPAQRDMEWHEHLGENWDQAEVEARLMPHDEGLSKELGVSGPFNSDDTYRVAVTLKDKGVVVC